MTQAVKRLVLTNHMGPDGTVVKEGKVPYRFELDGSPVVVSESLLKNVGKGDLVVTMKFTEAPAEIMGPNRENTFFLDHLQEARWTVEGK